MRMRSLFLLLAVFAGAFLFVRFVLWPGKGERKSRVAKEPTISQPSTLPTSVPAHYEAAPGRGSLAATMSPEEFSGVTRDAYKVAKEVPQTLAQLPCYCHCDKSIGHKSLHSCFEDDHAAHCATCVEEALMAYRLQTQGMNAAQIRERIIAEYSTE